MTAAGPAAAAWAYRVVLVRATEQRRPVGRDELDGPPADQWDATERSLAKLEALFNDLGRDGWELVALLPDGGYGQAAGVVVFKRPLGGT